MSDPSPASSLPGLAPEPAAAEIGRRRLRLPALGLVLTLLLSSCVFHEGRQVEIDNMGVRYRFYIYEKPSYQIVVLLKAACQNEQGHGQERWGRCSLLWLRQNVDVPALAAVDWNHFTEGGRWRDYVGAVDSVAAGRVTTDPAGQQYVDRCLIGSHAGFGAYDWGHRVTGDAHCRRGQYPR